MTSPLERLAIPIIQAPMLGASSYEMAVAVSRAGGLGSFAAAGTAPQEMAAVAEQLRRDTGGVFAMNLLMTPRADPSAGEVASALRRLEPWHAERGLAPPAPPNDYGPDFPAQLEALTEAAPPVASFTFGLLSPQEVAALKARGVHVIGTATTVAEARAWEAAGADAVCAQGAEAGGHRGTFLAPVEESLVGTLALVALCRRAVAVPVIAGGGIMDGAGVAAVLALGAAAAQMGTAFLLADQTAVSAPWRRAIETAPDDATRVTRAFTGRHARGIENAFMRAMRPVEDGVPAYPVQNRLTQPLRQAGARTGDAEVLSLWAGQGVKLARPGEAGELVRAWWDEARAASEALSARTAR